MTYNVESKDTSKKKKKVLPWMSETKLKNKFWGGRGDQEQMK